MFVVNEGAGMTGCASYVSCVVGDTNWLARSVAGLSVVCDSVIDVIVHLSRSLFFWGGRDFWLIDVSSRKCGAWFAGVRHWFSFGVD